MGLGYIVMDHRRFGTKKVNECRACRQDVGSQLEDRDVDTRPLETESEAEIITRVKNATRVDMTLHNKAKTFKGCGC